MFLFVSYRGNKRCFVQYCVLPVDVVNVLIYNKSRKFSKQSIVERETVNVSGADPLCQTWLAKLLK